MTTEIDYDARRFELTLPVPTYFLNIDEPRRVSKSPKEEPKYSLNYGFAPDSQDLKGIRAKIMEQALWFARSGEDGSAEFRAVAGSTVESISAAIKSGALKVPIADGDELATKAKANGKDREAFRGKKILTARSTKAPQVGIIANGAIVDLETVEQIKIQKAKFFYGGVHCVGEIDIKAYGPVGEGGKPGITAYLSSVLSTGRGEKIGGGKPSMAEKFRGHVGLASDEDPTGEAGADGDW